MKFVLLKNKTWPPADGKNVVYLHQDNWNDDNFKTTFDMHVHDEKGILHSIGSVKIAKIGQERKIHTYELLDKKFDNLPDSFYSLGQTEDYYLKLMSLSEKNRENILSKLNDLTRNASILDKAKKDEVLSYSILRNVSLTSIEGQFKRITEGLAILTNFDFDVC